MKHHLLTCLSIILLACHPAQAELTPSEQVTFDSILKSSKAPASLTLYEGLPHQYHEPEIRQREIDTKRVVVIHGESFYEKPIKVGDDDIEPLRQISSLSSGYKSIQGFKMCGGFHADYCLKWISGTSISYVLICFGCGEIKFCDEKQTLISDLKQDTGNRFGDILRKYREQRPPRK